MKYVKLCDNTVQLRNKNSLVCGNDELIIKLKACGICGSDLGNINSISSKPTEKLGHEISGIVYKIGKNIKNFKIGERVILNHHCSCKECHYCLHFNETMCPKFKIGISPCGFSEEILVSKWIVDNGGVIKLPSNISFEKATLIEPLACCLRSWRNLSYKNGDSVAIFGFGPIGALHGILAKNFGFKKIICIDKSKSRLNFCRYRKIGIPMLTNDVTSDKISLITDNGGVDIVIIATSDLSTLVDAISIIRKGGTILIFGEPEQNCKINLNMELIHSKEISIISSYATTNDYMLNSLSLLEKDLLNVDSLISNEFHITKINDAIDLAKRGIDRMKVIVTCD